MNLRLLIIIYCGILFLASSCSNDSSQENNDKDGKQDNLKVSEETYLKDNNSLLWEISGNDLKAPSYLYGTMHMISEKHFELGENLVSKFKEVEYLAMEVEDITDIGALGSVMTELYLDSGKISDYVSDSLYRAFIKSLEIHAGISLSEFESKYGGMKPFALYTIISQQNQTLGKLKSYEHVFMDYAYHNNLKLIGLETIHDQLNVFNSVSVEDMLIYIMSQLNMPSQEVGDDMMEELGRIYATHNLDSIVKYAVSTDDMLMSKYRYQFLTKRNKNWIPVIKSIIHEYSCFIAVGAAHLPGEDGVIKLLQNEGYNVRPIEMD